MSEERIIRCDGPNCGKVKGEANKWIEAWVRYAQNESLSKLIPIAIMIGSLEDEFIRILGDSDDNDYQREDFCSDACLHKRINQVLDAVRQESLVDIANIQEPPLSANPIHHHCQCDHAYAAHWSASGRCKFCECKGYIPKPNYGRVI